MSTNSRGKSQDYPALNRGKRVDKSVSLAPLTVNQAIAGLFAIPDPEATKPPKRKPPKRKPTEPR